MPVRYITTQEETKNAQVSSFTSSSHERAPAKRIAVHSRVKLRELIGPNIISFQITPELTDNYEQKTISSKSELAIAVLGAYEGDIVGFKTKAGYRKFLVIFVD